MGSMLRVYGLVPESIVDGPGLRYTVFVQGCSRHCPGCHNPESQPVDTGLWYDVDDIFADIRANRILLNVTFSGGEPFEQPVALAELAHLLKDAGYGLWCYSGYTYEELRARGGADVQDAAVQDLLDTADVLVDGPFVQALRSLELPWRGSANQRIIDLQKTNAARGEDGEHVVLWEPAAAVSPELLRRPASW